MARLWNGTLKNEFTSLLRIIVKKLTRHVRIAIIKAVPVTKNHCLGWWIWRCINRLKFHLLGVCVMNEKSLISAQHGADITRHQSGVIRHNL